MSFNIVLSEIDEMVEGTNQSISAWLLQLYSIRTKLYEFVCDADLTGTGAENIKKNLEDVYVFAVDSMITALVAYNTQLVLYSGNLFDLEGDKNGKLSEECMEEIQKKITEFTDETDDAYDKYTSYVKDISHLLDVNIGSKYSYKKELIDIKTDVYHVALKTNDLDSQKGGCNCGELSKISDLIEGVIKVLNKAYCSQLSLRSPSYSKDLTDDNFNNLKGIKKDLDDYNKDNRKDVLRFEEKNSWYAYDYNELQLMAIIDSLPTTLDQTDYVKIALFLVYKLVTLNSDDSMTFDEFIPTWINDHSIIKVFENLAKSLPSSIIADHYYNNMQRWKELIKTACDPKTGYIEYQDLLDLMEYGMNIETLNKKLMNNGTRMNASSNTCEIIAVYNTLVYLNGGKSPVDFPDLIKRFEEKGVTLYGYFGTSPMELDRYLNSQGYKTTMLVDGEDKMDYNTLQNKYDTFIVTVYNNKEKVSSQIHTMSITHEGGKYYLHNTFDGSAYEGNSIEDVLSKYKNGNSEVISIIGVGK